MFLRFLEGFNIFLKQKKIFKSFNYAMLCGMLHFNLNIIGSLKLFDCASHLTLFAAKKY